MESSTDKEVIPDEFVTSKIYVIREKLVTLDEDAAIQRKLRQQHHKKVGFR